MCWCLLSLNCQICHHWKRGHVPAPWKNAVVKPMLKKTGIDPILKNYRPVSNLLFAAKIAEKAVIDQLMAHCTTSHLLPDNQSSHRKHHSTETALVKVHNVIIASMDNQEATFLILLDLGTAFYTINHSLMMDILENNYFGIVVKRWFRSYLDERQQWLRLNNICLTVFSWILAYLRAVSAQYADDTQLQAYLTSKCLCS